MPSVKAGNINLNYDTFGDGEPLLLIMGFGMSGAGWIPSLPFFNGFKSIYFDNRGTGLSDKPDGIYTVEAMADDASNLLRALGIAKAKVFGVSMGGMIAQELTLRHPDQVSKVVLGCTMAGGTTAKMASPEILERLMTANKIMATDPEKGFDILLPALMPPEFIAQHPEIKPMMVAGAKAMPPTPPETADRALAGIQHVQRLRSAGTNQMPGADRPRRQGRAGAAGEREHHQEQDPAGRVVHHPRRRPRLSGRRPDRHPPENRQLAEELRNSFRAICRCPSVWRTGDCSGCPPA